VNCGSEAARGASVVLGRAAAAAEVVGAVAIVVERLARMVVGNRRAATSNQSTLATMQRQWRLVVQHTWPTHSVLCLMSKSTERNVARILCPVGSVGRVSCIGRCTRSVALRERRSSVARAADIVATGHNAGRQRIRIFSSALLLLHLSDHCRIHGHTGHRCREFQRRSNSESTTTNQRPSLFGTRP
jgi:hypothetical protein